MKIEEFFGFRKKEKGGKTEGKKEFAEMNKKEKKQFLSNDFIDRMIRVEQRVFHSLGEHVSVRKTKYYKSLTKDEKKNFERYLIGKGRKRNGVLLVLFLSLLSLVFLKIEFTGKVVEEITRDKGLDLITSILFVFFLVILFLLLIFFVLKKMRNRKFEKHFDILDIIGLDNYIRRLK